MQLKYIPEDVKNIILSSTTLSGNSGIFTKVNTTGQMIYDSVFVTCTDTSGNPCNDNLYIYFGDSPTNHTI